MVKYLEVSACTQFEAIKFYMHLNLLVSHFNHIRAFVVCIIWNFTVCAVKAKAKMPDCPSLIDIKTDAALSIYDYAGDNEN